ncbi:hypothetical protein WJX84_007967 [Apatococcus fuscideae]|uniref:Glucosidase 2 subunit beta n=1 Tax=Apatococcus fuscideae TaxID=2026836 RepID=A0AAW1TKN8_9CHLO
MRSVLVSGVALCILAQSVAEPLLRGVDPSLAAAYVPREGKFSCFDKSQVISSDRLNDDYCDCVDGSDEPGSSACTLGKFYCRNRGHASRRLNSSMVDDGFCDCCDGSDEQPGKCPNTCKEEGAARRAELKAQAKAFAQGYSKREAYVREAAQKKAAWQSELKGLEGQIRLQDADVKTLQGRKDTAEAAEKAERDREDAHKAASGSTPQEPITEAAADVQGDDGSSGTGMAADSEEAMGDDDGEYEAMGETSTEEEQPAADAAEAPASGKTEEEMAQERMAQWIKSDTPTPPPPEAAAPAPPTPELQQLLEEARAATRKLPTAQQLVSVSFQQDESRPDAQEQTSTEARPEQPQASAQQAEAEAAETAAEASAGAPGWFTSTLDTLRGYVGLAPLAASEPGRLAALSAAARMPGTKLQGFLGLDFGPDDAWLPLHNKCFDTRADKYTYEMCIFGSAAQKDAHLHTSLGSWEGFKNGYALASFTNGQHCWQGPPRSLQVSVGCGSSEQVSKVDEPNRCEYTASFVTPAACSPALVERAQKDSAAAEQDLLGHDEL